MLALLSEAELTPDDMAVMVVPKPWMLGASSSENVEAFPTVLRRSRIAAPMSG
jgi:hypothetical protein